MRCLHPVQHVLGLMHPLPAAVLRTSVEGQGVCLAAHCMLCPAVLTCRTVCNAAPQMQSMPTASWTSSRWTAGAGQWTGPISQTSEPCFLLCTRMAAAGVLTGASLGCATILLLQHVSAAACVTHPEQCRAAQRAGITPRLTSCVLC